MNSVYKEYEQEEKLTESQKKEIRTLMKKRVSYRGVYKLHDTVNTIHESLNTKLIKQNNLLNEKNI